MDTTTDESSDNTAGQQGEVEATSVKDAAAKATAMTLDKRNLQIERRKRRKIIDSDSNNNNMRLMKNDTEDDEVEKVDDDDEDVDFFDVDKLDDNLENLTAEDLEARRHDHDDIKPKLKKLEDALKNAGDVVELRSAAEAYLKVLDAASKQSADPLALTMEEENLEKLTAKDIMKKKTDRVYLEDLKKKLEKLEKKLKNVDVDKYSHVGKLWSAAQTHLQNLDYGSKNETKEMTRVEDIRYKVDTQALLHTYDLISFTHSVLELFKWHEDDHVRKKYMAPSFPMVQSSGMGKTKLLFEFRALVQQGKIGETNLADYDCRTILCLDATEPKDENNVDLIFSAELVVLKNHVTTREEICATLDALLTGCKKKKVIFLFDETQHLLADDGYHFRCVRWWLRRIRTSHQVVAVFTGTTSRLTNFYREPTASTTSRDAAIDLYHADGKDLYPPFHDLCTIGVKAITNATNDGPVKSNVTDYEKAIPYGRPLFALIHEDKRLEGEKLCNILRRMVLQPSPGVGWDENVDGCLSILGTRMQMGQTSVTLASKLVSNGYALLTHYSSTESRSNESVRHHVARLSFPTDPVCARLAMALMDDTFNPDFFQKCSIRSQCKFQWVQLMSNIFSTGLCLPNQGDLGELAAAAFLLFCGDLLRKKANRNYEVFSVLLKDFVQCLLNPDVSYKESGQGTPSYDGSQDAEVEEYEFLDLDPPIVVDPNNAVPNNAVPNNADPNNADPNDSKNVADKMVLRSSVKRKAAQYTNAEVGFIQVVGNYLRVTMNDINDQNFMKGLYDSGCAFYCYPRCYGIDLIGSIRLTCTANKYRYVPLLVSVSTTATRGFQRQKLNDMKKLLKDAGNFGFCLRLLFARPGEKIRKNENHLTEADVDEFLRGEIVSKILIVPADDPFGIVRVLLEKTSLAPPTCEVYTSHSFLPLLNSLQNPATLVRKTADEDVRKYVHGMHRGIQHKV